jgi:hypothetical protein
MIVSRRLGMEYSVGTPVGRSMMRFCGTVIQSPAMSFWNRDRSKPRGARQSTSFEFSACTSRTATGLPRNSSIWFGRGPLTYEDFSATAIDEELADSELVALLCSQLSGLPPCTTSVTVILLRYGQRAGPHPAIR